MRTTITINYGKDGSVILTGYGEQGQLRDLTRLNGRRIVSIEEVYDDIEIVTED